MICVLTSCVGGGASADVAALPAKADLRPAFAGWQLPLRRQGHRGTCSVFALTGALEYALASHAHAGTVLSVEFLNWASNQAATNSQDGGFFADLWRGYQAYGICAETNFPYHDDFDPQLHPADAILLRARETKKAGLSLHWIKPWDVTTGVTEAQFAELKRTLARGWPVCGGFRWPKHEAWPDHVLQMAAPADVFDGHSVLLVGFKDEAGQPGGGVFLIRNSGGGPRDAAIPYDYVRAYLNDAAWIEAGPARN
jgi:hypothetical protein